MCRINDYPLARTRVYQLKVKGREMMEEFFLSQIRKIQLRNNKFYRSVRYKALN